jgi:hypothetical protein
MSVELQIPEQLSQRSSKPAIGQSSGAHPPSLSPQAVGRPAVQEARLALAVAVMVLLSGAAMALALVVFAR